MNLDTIGKHLSHGFYQISANRAGRLCRASDTRLPRHGYERMIEVDGGKYWIARTPHQNVTVWSIRAAR